MHRAARVATIVLALGWAAVGAAPAAAEPKPEFEPQKKRQGLSPAVCSPRIARLAYGLLGVLGAPAAAAACRPRKFLTSKVLLPKTSL